MHVAYRWVSGPLAWIALVVFFGGLAWRVIGLVIQVRRKEPFIFSYMSLRHSLRSIIHWAVPFAATNWRRHPVLTVVTFVFHFCLVVTPIFLLAHVVLVDEAWNLSWWTLPEPLADAMAMAVVACCVFFLVRRLVRPEVRFVTDGSDFALLAVVALPFLTGVLAYHQWLGGGWMTVIHIFSGEVMLVAVPFTRLAHMVLSPLTRAYMGSEFGAVRHAKDW